MSGFVATRGANRRARLDTIAGKGSRLHVRHKLYLDIVSGGLPFLAPSPRWLDGADLDADLTSFHVQVLQVVDVVVSKLKRFHAYHLQDIEAMVQRALVDHVLLIQRFRQAVDGHVLDARAEDLPKYVVNLHQVECDLFGVPRRISSCRAGSIDELEFLLPRTPPIPSVFPPVCPRRRAAHRRLDQLATLASTDLEETH